MNKQDTVVVVVLFCALVAWFLTQKPDKVAPESLPVDQEEVMSSGEQAEETVASEDKASISKEPTQTPAEMTSEPVQDIAVSHETDEQLLSLVNSNIDLTVSSWGACVKAVKLLDYRQAVDEDSDPLVLDFADVPVLSINEVAGWSTNADFTVKSATASNVVLEASDGTVKLVRSISLGQGYDLSVRDEFFSLDGNESVVPAHSIEAGSMTKVETKSSVRGMTYLSVDSLPVGAEADVVHWTKTKSIALDGEGASKLRIEDRLQPLGRRGGCSMFKGRLSEMLPQSADLTLEEPTQWVAVKNKFFLSLLSPGQGASGMTMRLQRKVAEDETADNPASWQKVAVIGQVSAQMHFEPAAITGAEPFVREYTCYIGPKKYRELKNLGDTYGEIMQFGFWSPLSRILLTTLNAIYAVFRNYGVAIILLTVIVRMIFWPITHKSTESMKRMQAIQPEIKKIQEKYKDNPTKLNQATMALYKEHKVNPMAGCLPMFIQIPVFFALFTVLRSAVELRFAEFLWIRDLSEQEGLLANVLPIPLNILPLVMTVLTLFQQKMTPTAGDPQQQKMMMFMPVMFLFLFYPMPSALVLYWTTSQAIALVQLLLQRRKQAAKDAALAAA